MKWFRFYHEVIDDPKVELLPAEVKWFWVQILCLANQGNPRGVLPGVEIIAFRLRTTAPAVSEGLSRLKTAGLVDETAKGLTPHNWEDRQRAKDDSAVRVQSHRRRKKESGDGTPVTPPVTPDVTPEETPPETLQKRREKHLGNGSLTRARGEFKSSELESPLSPPPGGERGERAVPTDPDGEPFIPAGPDPNGGAAPAARALGPNSAEEVRRVLDLAEREFPLTGLGALVEQHLRDHPARRIVDAIVQAKTRKAGNPGRYIGAVLAGPDPTPAPRPAAPSRPEPAREVFRATPEELAEERRRRREYEASLTAPQGRPAP